MDLSNLKPARGSRRGRKRLGRGESSGLGKTSGKGHKGQNSRAGARSRAGFEGGQMPLYRRLPKFGFTKPNRVPRFEISLDELNIFENGATIDLETLKKEKIVSSKFEGRVKLLASGKLEKKLTVKLMHLSAGAKKAIETAGGSVVVIEQSPGAIAKKNSRKNAEASKTAKKL